MLTLTPIKETPRVPQTFEDFSSHINFIISQVKHTTKLLSLYTNDETYLADPLAQTTEMITHITDLLSQIFNTPPTLLHRWVFEFDCGESFVPGIIIDHDSPFGSPFRAPDLSTVEQLYDYMTYVYFRDKEEIYEEEAKEETN